MSIKTRKRKPGENHGQDRNRSATEDRFPGKNQDQARLPSTPMPQSSRRWLYIAIGLAVLAGIGTWALFENLIWSRIPTELVGKWVVVGGDQDGATFDFFRNGSMVARVNDHGSFGEIYATIRVDGKKIFSTSTRPSTGETRTSVLTIRTQMPNELVFEDDQGKIWTMKRAK